jgi:hypothetical protein
MAAAMRNATPLAQALGESFGDLLSPMSAVLGIAEQFSLYVLPKLTVATGMSEKNLVLLGTTLGALIFPFTRVLTVAGLVALALEDVMVWMNGGKSVIGEYFGAFDENQSLQNFMSDVNSLVTDLGYLSYEIEKLAEILSNDLKDALELLNLQDISILKEISGYVREITNMINTYRAWREGGAGVTDIAGSVGDVAMSHPLLKHNPIFEGYRKFGDAFQAENRRAWWERTKIRTPLDLPAGGIPGITPIDSRGPTIPSMAATGFSGPTIGDIKMDMTIQVQNLEDYAKVDEVARLMGERFKVEFSNQLNTAGMSFAGSNTE